MYHHPESEERQLVQGLKSGTCWVFPDRSPTLPEGELSLRAPAPPGIPASGWAPCCVLGLPQGPGSSPASPACCGHLSSLAVAAPYAELAASNTKQAGGGGARGGRPRRGSSADGRSGSAMTGSDAGAAPFSASPQSSCSPKALLLLSLLLQNPGTASFQKTHPSRTQGYGPLR